MAGPFLPLVTAQAEAPPAPATHAPAHDWAAELARRELRIVELQQQLYRRTPEPERAAQLVELLRDPLEGVRRAAVELAVQRLIAGQAFPPELRAELVRAIGDPAAAVRQAAAALLRDLAEEPAADAVAARIAEAVEPDLEVVRAYLKLLARMPRSAALPALIELLDAEPLRGDAAAALAGAIDARLMGGAELTALRDRLRDRLRDDHPPEPRVIELLARLTTGDGWARVVGWLDSPDPAVRAAAAAALASSDQPLAPLADRAGDAAVLPVLIEAAARRASDGATLVALARHAPAGEQALQAWRRALTAVAGRAPAAAVLEAQRTLEGQPASASLRAALLSAAINRLAGGVATAPADAPATRTASDAVALVPGSIGAAMLIDLLLARSAALVEQGDAAAALADARQAADLARQDAGAPRWQAQLRVLHALLAAGDHEAAATLAAELLAPVDGEELDEETAVADAFADHARRATPLTPLLLAQLRAIAAASASPHRERVEALLARLGPPASQVQPSQPDDPAPQPSAPASAAVPVP